MCYYLHHGGTLGASAALSRDAIMEAGFSKQGADWQANDVSWVSHYAPAPQTPSVAPSPSEIPCVDAQ